jgi:hypothetical protein
MWSDHKNESFNAGLINIEKYSSKGNVKTELHNKVLRLTLSRCFPA